MYWIVTKYLYAGKDNYDNTKKDKTYGGENGKRKFGVPHIFEV